MELFSQRQGIKPVKNIMQVNSIDAELRNKLWNAVGFCYWNQIGTYQFPELHYEIPTFINNLLDRLWHEYFKRPLDTMPSYWPDLYNNLRSYFYGCEWNEVYDFIEFIANNPVNQKFIDFCNSNLKEELSTYRFVGGKIVRITSDEEIAEIEAALHIPISPVQQHINRALELLSDKKSPDYRNSIKESISSVEAICKLIANNNKATLTIALETIEKGKKMKMHPPLVRAFKELYTYTNDADGIRHSLKDEPNLDLEDAKFMLVSCSAFINYLIIKSSKAGIKL
ncbi:MAG: hypothetical protein KKG76_09825 [Euryarchaeota archaeon]|nr:hypothetical protein [Euryarchaeota archaeon]